MSQITTSPFSSVQDAINDANDWQEAVLNAASFIVASYDPNSADPQHDGCFSSGEVSNIIRETVHPADQNFWHSVVKLGAHLRDLVWADTFKYDDGQGNPVSVLQVTRYTTGITRTPAGHPVFVYCPTQQAGLDHEFEVEIKDFSQAAAANASDGGNVRAPSPQSGPQRVNDSTTRLKPNARKASVAKDGRMYVNRQTIEALCNATQWPFRVGDPVFVEIDAASNEARISLQAGGNGKSYQLWNTGRAVFSDNGTGLFQTGNVHPISIANNKIVVDLSVTC